MGDTLTQTELRLSPQESYDFCLLEQRIKKGLNTFIEVGVALMEIRERKLYRLRHERFQDYCRERWGIKRAHAYRLISAVEVLDNLSPTGDTPKTERQVRPLTTLTDPDDQRAAWQAASEAAASEGRKVRVSRGGRKDL